MFFDSVDEIERIAGKTGAAVFVVPLEIDVKLPRALVLQPETKTVITIEQIRNLIARLGVKQISEQYIVLRPAESMNEEAANAFLKNLEEPKDKVHFVLVTSSPSLLLPTILSRCAVYFLRTHDDGGIKADAKVKELAKRLMVARGNDLVKLAEEITKKKDGVRAYALAVVGAAIEMFYKTYLITGKSAYLVRLPKFLKLYESLNKNGHIKLHLVADLI